MKKARWGIWFFVICGISFSMGIITGFIRSSVSSESPEENQPVKAAESVMREEETVLDVKKPVYYMVSSRGDYIVLSEIFDDDSESIVEMTDINKSVLPQSDIILLEEGIAFSDKDEALLMIENFIS